MGKIKKFYSRSELGMRAPRSVSRNITPGNGGVGVHYGGAAQRISSQKAARERWLQWQNYHMNHHGWADIAYTAGFDNWGNVYAGRGYGVRTAANGTNAGNQNYLAFVWLGGGNEKPSDSALEALNWLIEDARKNGAGNAVKDHNFFKATACAGAALRSRSRELDGQVNLPSPSSGDDEPRDYITVGDKGAEVRSWQEDLQSWNAGALPRFGADGDFGAETAEWTVRFYDAVGLTASDASAPRVGKASRDAMSEALKTSEPTPAPQPAPAPKPAPTPQPAPPTSNLLREGDRGAEVRKLQTNLNRFGARLTVDGVFGPLTATAVRNFQRSRNITVDGIVGPQTQAQFEANRFRDGCTSQVLRRGVRGRCVSDLQRFLNSTGINVGKVDSIFGHRTERGVRKFQTRNRLKVDGIVGPQTWGALNKA